MNHERFGTYVTLRTLKWLIRLFDPMFIFPIRTDRRIRSTPWVNYALISVNVLIFLFTEREIIEFHSLAEQGTPIHEAFIRVPLIRFFLWPNDAYLFQYFTYQFLHAGKLHLFFNMVFLYVFGSGVEDRLGKLGYFFFYLAAGVFAGIGHGSIYDTPILGASGSIAGVTGAYLAMFPLSYVTIFYIFDTFEVSSIVLISFRVAQDMLFQLMGGTGVAYLAHLVGYTLGFVVGMSLLVSRFVPREPYDMLALLEHRRRRAHFRRLARGGFHAWETSSKSMPGQANGSSSKSQERLMPLRAQVNEALAEHNLPEAARHYVRMLALNSRQVMGQQQQLDLASQLMSESRYDTAATAYELFLDTYKSYPQRQQVQLILGLIYARHLDQATRAKSLLAEAMLQLDGDDRQLAAKVLGEIEE